MVPERIWFTFPLVNLFPMRVISIAPKRVDSLTSYYLDWPCDSPIIIVVSFNGYRQVFDNSQQHYHAVIGSSIQLVVGRIGWDSFRVSVGSFHNPFCSWHLKVWEDDPYSSESRRIAPKPAIHNGSTLYYSLAVYQLEPYLATRIKASLSLL